MTTEPILDTSANNTNQPSNNNAIPTNPEHATTTAASSNVGQAATTTTTPSNQGGESPNQTGNEPTNILEKAIKNEEQIKDYWKEDWREKIAGEDEKLLKELSKHKSPAELANAYRELQKKFSSTRPLPELPKDASPEQVKEYREQLGIPEKWQDYDTNLENGVVIGEADRPIVEKMLEKFHERNVKPSEVKAVLQDYFNMVNDMEVERLQTQKNSTSEAEQALQKEWGTSYKQNIASVVNLLKGQLGEEGLAKLNGATFADGSPVINDVSLMKWFGNLAAKSGIGGNSTITPSPSTDLVSLKGRQAEIDKIFATDPKAYYASPELRQEKAEIDAILSKKR